MSKRLHFCLNVRGALDWPVKMRKKLFVRDDGTYFSASEAKEILLDELSKGHEVIPIGKSCEGFDYKKVCPGHKLESDQ